MPIEQLAMYYDITKPWHYQQHLPYQSEYRVDEIEAIARQLNAEFQRQMGDHRGGLPTGFTGLFGISGEEAATLKSVATTEDTLFSAWQKVLEIKEPDTVRNIALRAIQNGRQTIFAKAEAKIEAIFQEQMNNYRNGGETHLRRLLGIDTDIACQLVALNRPGETLRETWARLKGEDIDQPTVKVDPNATYISELGFRVNVDPSGTKMDNQPFEVIREGLYKMGSKKVFKLEPVGPHDKYGFSPTFRVIPAVEGGYRIPLGLLKSLISKVKTNQVLAKDRWNGIHTNYDVPMDWFKVLEKHGGYVEPGYSARLVIPKITLVEYLDERISRDNQDYRLPKGFPLAAAAHYSDDRKMIACYPTLRAKRDRKPVIMRPGKYLKRFFPHFSDDEVREISSEISMESYTLGFYQSFDDMYKYYRELHTNDIVTSCMSERKSYFNGPHPLRVYDHSDVELAVMFNARGEARARALYNKKTREYPMIYGAWEIMKQLLDAKTDLEHGSLEGAEIKLISEGCRIVMPYIDGKRELDRSHNNATRVDVYSDHCVISDGGTYGAGETNGYIDDDSYRTCDCCGTSVHEDDTFYVQDELVCESCYDSKTTEVHQSRGDSERVYNSNLNNYIEIDGEYYQDAEAAEYNGFVYSNWDNEWHNDRDVTWVEDGAGRDADYVPDDELSDVCVEINNHHGSDEWVWAEVAKEDCYYELETGVIHTSEVDDSVPVSELKERFAERPDSVPECLWKILRGTYAGQGQTDIEEIAA